MLQDAFFLAPVGSSSSCSFSLCAFTGTQQNPSSAKDRSSCLKLWFWPAEAHRQSLCAAVIHASLHNLQYQELPKDRTPPTMPPPAANWGLFQGCPNPFGAGQKDPFFQTPVISNTRCCHWRASREALSEGHTGLTQVFCGWKEFSNRLP